MKHNELFDKVDDQEESILLDHGFDPDFEMIGSCYQRSGGYLDLVVYQIVGGRYVATIQIREAYLDNNEA